MDSHWKPPPKPPLKKSDEGKKSWRQEVFDANPIYAPKQPSKRFRTAIKGESKKKAIVLSEILRNPYL